MPCQGSSQRKYQAEGNQNFEGGDGDPPGNSEAIEIKGLKQTWKGSVKVIGHCHIHRPR